MSRRGRAETLLDTAARFLRRRGVSDARAEAERLWEGVSGVTRARILAGTSPDPEPEQARRFLERLRRVAAGEPLAYVEETCAFHGIQLRVDRRVLVPRPDSECLVEAALERLPPPSTPLVLDLGTGSGCLLLAVLAQRAGARGVGVDRSAEALELARDNARRLGLAARTRFCNADWLSALGGGAADLLLANPPYVLPGEPLGPGVAEWEPSLALFTPAGRPLAAYETILAALPGVLRPGGWLIFEVGAGRAREVAELCRRHGLEIEAIRPDLAGIPRAVVARANPQAVSGRPRRRWT